MGRRRSWISATTSCWPEPEPYGGLLPPKPGAQAANRGFQNELEVAKITGGKLARDATKISKDGTVADLAISFKQPNGQGGKVAIDVLGPNNELIVVGGPAKGGDLGKLVSRLTDLKRAAEQRNVGAIAYFTEDTPADVLDKARRTLGAESVRLFKRPPYRQP
jgi:hypothetical protein